MCIYWGFRPSILKVIVQWMNLRYIIYRRRVVMHHSRLAIECTLKGVGINTAVILVLSVGIEIFSKIIDVL